KQKIRDLIAPRFQAMRASMPASGQITNRMLAGGSQPRGFFAGGPGDHLRLRPQSHTHPTPRRNNSCGLRYTRSTRPDTGRPVAGVEHDLHYVSHDRRIRAARVTRDSQRSAIRRDDSNRMAAGRICQGEAETDRKSHSLEKMEQYLAVRGKRPKTIETLPPL